MLRSDVFNILAESIVSMWHESMLQAQSLYVF